MSETPRSGGGVLLLIIVGGVLLLALGVVAVAVLLFGVGFVRSSSVTSAGGPTATAATTASGAPRWPGVTLPPGAGEEMFGDPRALVVMRGRVSMDGAQLADVRVALEQLAERLRLIAERVPSRPFDGDLLLVVDRSAQVGEVSDVLRSAAAAGFDRVRLAVAGPTGEPVSFPLQARADVPPERAAETHDLTIHIRDDGLSITAFGRVLAPACDTAGPPAVPTVPLQRGELDIAGEVTCLERVQQREGYETGVTIAARRERPWRDAVSVMSAARPIFSDVQLAVD